MSVQSAAPQVSGAQIAGAPGGMLTPALARLDDNADGVAVYFASHLLATTPALADRWPVGLAAQRRAGWFSLRAVVAGLERGEDPDRVLEGWGRAFLRLGLGPDDLTAMVASVEATLRRFLGDAFMTAHAARLSAVHQRMMPAIGRPFSDAGAGVVAAEVVAHERRGADLAVLTVRPAAPVAYRPGQSVPVALATRPHAWRPYTPAHAPRPDGSLQLHVRAVPGGLLSPALVYGTSPGDALSLAPAVGTLGWPDDDTDAVLVAGGTGVTPFAAMLEARARDGVRGAGSRVVLALCAARPDEHYVPESLHAFAAAHPWLTVHQLTGAEVPGTPWHGRQGAAGPGAAADGDPQDGDRPSAAAAWAGHHVVVCGAPAFTTGVVAALRAAGHDPAALHVEEYAHPDAVRAGTQLHGGGTA